jgi:GST-like protein
MDKRLNEVDYLAGDYSIADIATFPWARSYERRGVEISEFPSVSRWLTEMDNRPAVMRGMKILTNLREENKKFTDEEREVLFGAAQFKKR